MSKLSSFEARLQAAVAREVSALRTELKDKEMQLEQKAKALMLAHKAYLIACAVCFLLGFLLGKGVL